MSASPTSVQDNAKISALEGSALAAALVEQLWQARRTVRVCSFLCTLDVRVPPNSPARQVLRAIADAAQRGVDVKVLIGTPSDPQLNLLNSVAARYLNERGAATRRVRGIDLHAKFVIIDDGCCTIGSHNLTHKALSQNAELSAIVWDAATAGSFTKTFAEMWEKASTTAIVPQVGKRQSSIQRSPSKSWKNFAAARASRVAFDTIEVLEDSEYLKFCEAALAKAQHRIFVAMGLMTFSGLRTHPARQLIERLMAAHDRGVDVNVFTDGARSGRRSAAAKLQAANVPVHFSSNGRSFHHKALVIDDQLTIIGSHNWTLPALSKSKEISLAIRSTPLAFQMTQAIVTPFAAL